MKRQRAFMNTSQAAMPKKRKIARTMTLSAPQKRAVGRIVKNQAEKKHFLASISAAGISSVGTVASISNVTQGDGDNERVGNVISPTECKLNFSISASDTTNAIRVCIFKWKDTNAFIAPNANDFFKPGPSASVDYLSHYNEEQRDQFVVKYDKTFQLVLNQANTKKNVSLNIPLSGKIRYYSNSVVTGTGIYYLYYISDSLAVTHPTIEWASELVYTDQ